MKKLLKLLPVIIGAILIVLLIMLFSGVFDAPKEVTITSSTLTEVIKTAKLTTAKYIQNGIAMAKIEGKEQGYILYYAIVKANVDFEAIKHEVDEESKTVIVTLPEKISFDVELLSDEETHKWYYHPDNKKDWTGKDAIYICTTDAKSKAEKNDDLIKKAYKSLENTLKALLEPLLSESGYQLEFVSANNEGV